MIERADIDNVLQSINEPFVTDGEYMVAQGAKDVGAACFLVLRMRGGEGDALRKLAELFPPTAKKEWSNILLGFPLSW